MASNNVREFSKNLGLTDTRRSRASSPSFITRLFDTLKNSSLNPAFLPYIIIGSKQCSRVSFIPNEKDSLISCRIPFTLQTIPVDCANKTFFGGLKIIT